VGRAELFNENFFDPTAALVEGSGSQSVLSLGRLWVVTFVFNLVGGGLFALVFAVNGVLPSGAAAALQRFATESIAREPMTWFASAIVGGALVTLLSFLLAGVNRVGSRITLAYVVGALLALGPFDHVVVTALHVFVGALFGAPVDYGGFVGLLVVVTAGNVAGGLGLVTLTHVVQAMGARESDG
jgi:formate/nitrite transporter FocA (FNT family)